MPLEVKAARLQWRDGSRYMGRAVEAVPLVIGGRHGDISVPGSTVSRRHASVFRDEGGVWIEDLGGDGVLVNGARVTRTQLVNRDRLQIGALELEFWEG